jgi:hypothetical protein
MTDDGELEKCILQCAKCKSASPNAGIFSINDPKAWGGSTGRYRKHFQEQHTSWWESVESTDKENGVVPSKRPAQVHRQARLDDTMDNVSSSNCVDRTVLMYTVTVQGIYMGRFP